MIVKMSKVYVASRSGDRNALLDTLAGLGAVHLAPVDPSYAVAEEKTLADIKTIDRAVQTLGQVTPAGAAPDVPARKAVEETLRFQRQSAEYNNRLSALYRQIKQLAVWGDVTLEQLAQLREDGIDAKFFSVPRGDLGEIRAECTVVVGELSGKRSLVAVVHRTGEPQLPDPAEEIPIPSRDRPSLRAEAAEIDKALAASANRLAELAHLIEPMRRERAKLQEQANFTVAAHGGLAEANLFAVQGWVPADRTDALVSDLSAAGVAAAVQAMEPAEDESPPTLIRYPAWTRPIKALFDILGTFPGYREIDLSSFFMIALPFFTAMLIGDAGYGLIFLIVPLLLYRRSTAALGRDKIHLLMVLGVATLAWGLLTGNVFGVTPQNMIDAGGPIAALGTGLSYLHIIGKGGQSDLTGDLMQLSFIFGTIHLVLGQLRQGVGTFPSPRFLSHAGWSLFLCGMLGVVWFLFFDSQKKPPEPINPISLWLLLVGSILAIVFASPHKNLGKMIGLGLADFPLAAIGTFSDIISYIRLMAVGLSSTIIAQTFNGLGYELAQTATWIPAVFVILFGHLLNVALCAIAVLAHGVRLNMLEFSNNAGVQWRGYAYQPFAKTQK